MQLDVEVSSNMTFDSFWNCNWQNLTNSSSIINFYLATSCQVEIFWSRHRRTDRK